jgi:hypothetical protein
LIPLKRRRDQSKANYVESALTPVCGGNRLRACR